MKNLSPSTKTYFGLVILLAILAGISIFLPQGNVQVLQELPASRPVLALINGIIMIVVYGGLGYVGLRLSRRLGFAGIWDPEVSNRQRFLLPAVIGVGIGIFIIALDLVLSKYHTLGRLPHPAFPASLVGSATAGIGEEILFRLFFIPFWMWLVSSVLLNGRWQNQVFWIVAVSSAIAFSVAHFPSVMYLMGMKAIAEIPLPLMGELFLINGLVSLFAAYHFRKHGFLAAVGVHFWTDVVWHVIWGLV